MIADNESAVEQWEYWTGFLWADARRQEEYLRQRWPDWNPPKYAPQALIPKLNEFGEKGWELVHMQPVIEGHNDDVAIGGGGNVAWSHTYLCVFKRRKRD